MSPTRLFWTILAGVSLSMTGCMKAMYGPGPVEDMDVSDEAVEDTPDAQGDSTEDVSAEDAAQEEAPPEMMPMYGPVTE
jgi:hypothetical protein